MTSNTVPNTPRCPWHKDWLAWVILGIILYSFLALLSLASDIGRPFPGFITYYNSPLNRIEIIYNVPGWWWFRDDNLPTITDTIISIENIPFTNLTAPIMEQTIYENLQASDKETVSLQIERDNKQLALDVPLRTFTWRYFVELTLAPLILSSSFILLAIILYQTSGTIFAQRIAILIFLAIAAITFTNASLFLYGQFHDHFLGYNNPINALAAIMIGPLLVHFSFHYPTSILQTRGIVAKLPRIIYILTFFPIICYFFSRFFTITQGITPKIQLFDNIFYGSVFSLIILGAFAVLLRMVSDGFFRNIHPRAYREARIMLAAFLVSLPAFWFAAYGAVGSSSTIANMQALADARYFVLAVPLAFATITLRYYPNQTLNKWLLFVWTLATSIILANIVLILLFYENPAQISQYPIPPLLVLLLLFLVLGLITNWQNSWQGWLGRLFNWERVNYHAVQQFGHKLAAQSTIDSTQLAQHIVTTLRQELSLEWAACWLTEGEQMQLAAINGRSLPNTPNILTPPPSLSDQPIRLTQTAPEWLRAVAPQAAVILPLTISSKTLGLIAVGQRWDVPIFDDRDLEILTLISQQAALMLHNARQTAQLRQTDQQLLHIQKLTRQKTAQNLHDHILPGLSQLQMKLLAATQLIDNQPQNAHKLLNESQESLRENAKLVRRIQKDLVIRPLEYGLAPYLQEMITQFQQDTGISVAADLPAALDTTITDISIRETIYAVWQQALDNIQQHAQATAVTITLSLDTNQLAFSICDNGRGSLPEQQEEAFKNGHFGLRSMQIRLQSVGGQFTFQSTPKQGSCVHGQIVKS